MIENEFVVEGVEGAPPAWLPIWDPITSTADYATYADTGTSTAGARTVLGKSAVIVNPSGALLTASNGFSVISGAAGGVQLDTTSPTTGATDDFAHSLGAGVYWSLSTLIDSSVFPNAQPGPEGVWRAFALLAMVDVSEINANGEGATIFFANNTSFGFGTSAVINQTSAVANVAGNEQANTFVASGSNLAGIGIGARPDCMMVIATHSGCMLAWGISPNASGLVYPTSWFSRDKYMGANILNGPETTGGVIRNTSLIGFGVQDVNKTSIKVRLKRISLYGLNPIYFSPTGSYAQWSVAA